ncbi:MAG: cysteine desulfurase family protein [bacterium]
MKRTIYLDNAATTPVRKEVVLAMRPYWNESFGNPGSITKMGVKAKEAVENARKIIAENLKVRSQEIIFTSGGTESNNLAIFGVVNSIINSPSKKFGTNQITDLHFITTNIEHSSVSECFRELERRGAKVDYLKVSDRGIVDPRDLRKIIKPNTVLISVGYANNEIGTVQPIKEIMKEIRHARKENVISNGVLPYFHTDASQAGLYLNLNINELGIDLMTLDAQKISGPKGIGILFIKAGVEISPIIFGGGQEKGLRSGTENVPLIVGMARALELARGYSSANALGVIRYSVKRRELSLRKLIKLRDYFWHKIQKEIPEAVLNGDLENRLPNNLNISIPGIDSELVVLCLDEAGIICSTRSACSQDEDGSFVVRALGKSDDLARSTLRFSLGEDLTKKDLDFVIITLKEIIKKSQNNIFV